MRINLIAVLAATIIVYLVLLAFRVSFGIALIIAIGVMAAGVKYVRSRNAGPDEAQEQIADKEYEDNM